MNENDMVFKVNCHFSYSWGIMCCYISYGKAPTLKNGTWKWGCRGHWALGIRHGVTAAQWIVDCEVWTPQIGSKIEYWWGQTSERDLNHGRKTWNKTKPCPRELVSYTNYLYYYYYPPKCSMRRPGSCHISYPFHLRKA